MRRPLHSNFVFFRLSPHPIGFPRYTTFQVETSDGRAVCCPRATKTEEYSFTLSGFLGVFMSASRRHELRNLLMIILGGVETNNLELSKQSGAWRRYSIRANGKRPKPPPFHGICHEFSGWNVRLRRNARVCSDGNWRCDDHHRPDLK